MVSRRERRANLFKSLVTALARRMGGTCWLSVANHLKSANMSMANEKDYGRGLRQEPTGRQPRIITMVCSTERWNQSHPTGHTLQHSPVGALLRLTASLLRTIYSMS